MKKFFSKRYKRHYQESKIHLFIDLAFVIIIIILIISNIILFNKSFPIKDITIGINHHANGNTRQEKKRPVINAKLTLNSDAAYYTSEGEQLGVGPWPPAVNETTSVRIFLEITPDIHRVKNLQLKARLPSKITWLGNSAVSLGQAIFYDKKSRLIIWALDSLDIKQKARASFEIEFTPTQKDFGNRIKLLENLSASAIDKITGQGISAFGNNLYSPKVE